MVPLADMLEASFSGLVPGEQVDPAAHSLEALTGSHQNEVDLDTSLSKLTKSLKRELAHGHEPDTAEDHLVHVAQVLDTLLAICSFMQLPAIEAVHIHIRTSLIFRYLHYIQLSSPLDVPVVMLVGAVVPSPSPQSIPLPIDSLANTLELGFVADDPVPRLKTDLFARFRPSPVSERRRLHEWTIFPHGQRVELYENPRTARIPSAMITIEPITFPWQISTARLEFQIEPEATALQGLRMVISTSLDQVSLLIVDRIVTPY